MRWTAARARVEALWAPAVKGRARLYVARYRHTHDSEGRGWITWDGEQIASFETLPYFNRKYPLSEELQAVGEGLDEAWDLSEVITNREGEFALWQFTDAVEEYPSLTVEQALASDDALVRALRDARSPARQASAGDPRP